MPDYQWTSWQFRYLNLLWMRESGWNRFACNHSSGAYGIPQAVPGDKMASAGPELADERAYPDHLGHGLHQVPLRRPVERVAARAAVRLVLAARGAALRNGTSATAPR